MIDLITHAGEAWTLLAGNINVDPQQPPGTSGLLTLLNWLAWIVAAACLGGVLIAGAVMAWSHSRGMGGNEGTSRLGWSLAACVIVGAASTMVGALV